MRSLARLLRPRSIAVIGGGYFASNVVEQCLKMGFAGEVWPVHPSKDAIGGVRAFASVADLPGAPDAAFVGVNRILTVDMVHALRERGAGGAVCFAAGFRETGACDPQGEKLQRALVEAAGDMPVIGPNCYGLINYADGALLWPDQHGGARLAPGARGAAILTQSSNIAINMTMQRRGLPLAYLMTAGNQAQTGLSDLALGLIEDERVSCLGLHVEGFDSLAGFERLAARARALGKPVVAMKVGRSEQARAATVSHTASIAGPDAASGAFLKRLGIARVDTIPSLIETLKLFHAIGPLLGGRLSSMSCSGGEASLMADAAEGRRVSFPALSAAHAARVAAVLGPLVAIANPLDYNTWVWNDGPAMTAAFGAMVSGGFDLDLLVLDFPRADRCSDADWWPAVDAFDTALRANGARGAIVASLPENLPEAHCARLLARGIAPLCGIAEAFDAAEAAAFVGAAWRGAVPAAVGASQATPTPNPSPQGGGGHERRASESPSPLWGGVRGGGRALSAGLFPDEAQPDEAGAKALLGAAGLPVPGGRRVSTVADAVAAAGELGFPVALKALGIAHKSEAGAVRLDLADAGAVAAAAEALDGLGSGLYVEAMVTGGVAELIVGILRDPLFGPVLTLGFGGVLVELLDDTATLLLPAMRDDIEAALRGLRLFPLLDGYRGRPRADLAAAIGVICGIADFALANRDAIAEFDVNPLIVRRQGGGAWIADVLLVAGKVSA